MSKIKSPPEKKLAAYERDHFTFAWYSPHVFRKTWKKKKSRINRVVRRKSKDLLHVAEGRSLNQMGPQEERLSSELFRLGLTKKKLRKDGVVSLQDKVRIKNEIRQRRGKQRRELRQQMLAIFKEGIRDLERGEDTRAAQLLLLGLNSGSLMLRTFFDEHPAWRQRLRMKLEETQKQQKVLAERARLKAEQKRKWNREWRSMNVRA